MVKSARIQLFTLSQVAKSVTGYYCQYLVIYSAFYVTDMTVVKQMDYVIGNPLGGVRSCLMSEG